LNRAIKLKKKEFKMLSLHLNYLFNTEGWG